MVHTRRILFSFLALAAVAAFFSTASAAPRRGGILVVGTPEEPRSLNPLFAQSRLEREIAQCLFGALYRTDDDGDYLADLLTGIPKRNGLAYQYELRKGVRFSDGHELTAEDVEFTWKYLAGLELSGPRRAAREAVASFSIPLLAVKDKEGKTRKTPDKYHFTVTLKEAEPSYEALWADLPILPAHILGEEMKATGGKLSPDGDFSRHPTGSGPFKLAEWQPGIYLMMVQNPLYFRSGQPYLEEMIWRFVPDAGAGLEELRKREIDLLLDVPAASAGEAARIPGVALCRRPTSTCSQIVLNLWDPKDLVRPHPILGDVRVRRALDLALPRERIVEEALANQAYPAYTGLPPFSRFHCAQIAAGRFDPEKARGLLEEAGWLTGPDGYRYKDGGRLRLTLFAVAGNQSRERTTAICREAWRAIGVDLAVVFLDLAAFSADCLAKRGFDLAMFSWEADLEPGPSSPWHSSQVPGESGEGRNYGGYANREMDGLLAEMGKTGEMEEKEALCRRVQEIMAEDVPSIFVDFHARIAAMREGLRNFRPNPAADADFWNVAEWYWAW